MIDLTTNIDSAQAKQQLQDIFSEAQQLTSNAVSENDQTQLAILASNKAYWEERRKIALEALEAIDEAQKKQMDAGNFSGVAPEVIESYREYTQALQDSGIALSMCAAAESSASSQDPSAPLEKNLDQAAKSVLQLAALFDDMSQKSIADIHKIANEAKDALKFISEGEYTADNPFGITQEDFDLLSKSPEKQKELKDTIRDTKHEANNTTTAFGKISHGFKDMFDSSKTLGEQKEAMKSVSEGFSEASKAVGLLSNAFTSLGDTFGNDTLSGIGDSIGVLTDTLSGMSSGVAAGAAFGPIGAAAGGAIGGVLSLTTSLAKLHDKAKEKTIKKYQGQIDDLKRACNDLEDSIGKAYSTDKAKLIDEENKKLEEQKANIQSQIDEENKKKKTDHDRIKQWQNEQEDIDKQIKENKQRQIDAIYGETVQQAIDNFATAYMNAWAKGDERAKTSADLVKLTIKNMIAELIKGKLSTDKFIDKLREKIDLATADGVITAEEEKDLQDFVQDEMDAIQKETDWANRFIEEEKEEEKSEQKATSKGFETMSQDTGNELNGRFTVMTDLMLQSRDIQQRIMDAGLVTADMATNIRDVALQANLHLRHISNNTGMSATALQGINTRLKRIEENTAYLK